MRRYLHWGFRFKRIHLGKKTWSNIAYAQTGNLLTTLGSYAPLYFLSGLGTGVIAALNYAQQLVTQPTTFITVQFASVARIKMSELYVKEDFKQVNTIFLATAKFLVFILVPISGLLFLYANEIITILFKRGSFDAGSVSLSSDFLRYLGLSLPFTAIISVAGNLYVAAQLIRASIAWQIISNLLLIGLVYLSLRFFGHLGYPLAFLGINIVNTGVVYIFCRLFFQFIDYPGLLKYLIILLGFNALIVLGLFELKRIQSHSGPLPVVITGGLVYGAVILAANRMFHLNRDLTLLLGQIGRKITPGIKK
jgi:peptidoglycan biosynthesis protein MviN/MurJ (putative lipid II flippase)